MPTNPTIATTKPDICSLRKIGFVASFIIVFIVLSPAFAFKANAGEVLFSKAAEEIKKELARNAIKRKEPAPPNDPPLDAFASLIAARELSNYKADKHFALNKSQLDFFAHKSGIYTPHIVPILLFEDKPLSRMDDLLRFFSSWWRNSFFTRIGVGVAGDDKARVIAVILADQAALLDPLPDKMLSVPKQLQVSGRLLKVFENPRLFIRSPSRTTGPFPLTTNKDGLFAANIYLDEPGKWDVEIMADSQTGPRIAALAHLYAMIEPPHAPVEILAPNAQTSIKDKQDLLKAVNVLRSSVGAQPLLDNDKLSMVAYAQAEKLFEKGSVEHRIDSKPLSERLKQSSIAFSYAGENIAYNTSLEEAFNAMLSSPSHRAAIENKAFQKIGIAVKDLEERGVYVVMIFTAENTTSVMSEKKALDLVSERLSIVRRRLGLEPLSETPALAGIARAFNADTNNTRTELNKWLQSLVSQNKIRAFEIVALEQMAMWSPQSLELNDSMVTSFTAFVYKIKDSSETAVIILYGSD